MAVVRHGKMVELDDNDVSLALEKKKTLPSFFSQKTR
jgi:hypothetical protein